ncbi:MAG: DNA polymerase [Armatimonadetes bacterium]|nr:DNA polymerase [Armatimonadota bacterium]
MDSYNDSEMALDDKASANPALSGANTLEGVVGLEARTPVALLYRRINDELEVDEVPWRPWLLSAQQLSEAPGDVTHLDGTGHCWLYQFDGEDDFHSARDALREAHAGIVAYPSLQRQFLISTGITFFKGMAFDGPRRMQIDIETNALGPRSPGAKCLMVAVSDNRGFQEAVAGDEPEIFERLNAIIAERDPDIIEGHNFYSFDMPFLAARAEACGAEMRWGRDLSLPCFGQERNMPFGGITRPYIPVHIQGRSIIDTLLGVQRYDVARGELTSHGLKDVAIQLGIAPEDRVYLDAKNMERLWREDPERVKAYALQDVYETGELARIVMPPDFYVSQMVPDTYQANATGGTGEKINLLLVREYLRQRRALPVPKPGRTVTGGYTELKRTGLIERVVKADVESLYPSLMLSRNIAPSSDTLGVFLPLLRELTRRRLDAKARKAATQGAERTYWDGLQASFKILINSFYGYLGTNSLFNDPDAAERVTLGGQEIIRAVEAELERTGSSVIEVDTDGVYFQPPREAVSEAEEEDYIRSVARVLPEAIHLAHDGRWKAMISLKVKNYVLLGYDGRRIYRGAALRSRADERFGQQFLTEAVDLIADGRTEEIKALYMACLRRIHRGELRPEEFARRERVTEKSLQGRSLQRAQKALQGAERGEYVRLYRRLDGTLARLEDYASDEDREYLEDKLYKFAQRLAPALEDRFELLCPSPRGPIKQELDGQQSLDLFS